MKAELSQLVSCMRRKAMLGDMAILTGGTVISEDLGLKLENLQLSQLGKVKQVKVNKDEARRSNAEKRQNLRGLADKHVVNQNIQYDQYDVGHLP